MHQVTRKCACCDQMSKCRHRDFNSQIWVLLLHWGEIDESALEQPICDSCYRDLRNLLIDRADEMEQLLSEGITLEDVLARRIGLRG